MGLLDEGLPRSVAVGGAEVPIRTGFRSALRSYRIDASQPAGRAALLAMWFGGPSRSMEGLHPAAAADPRGAVEAALAWRDGAWGCMSYGPPPARRARARLVDLECDAAAIAADFRRLYGADLLDPATQMHWWEFCALLQAASRTDGSLVGAAVRARDPEAAKGLKGAALKGALARERAWRLPPTAEEARARAMAEMG